MGGQLSCRSRIICLRAAGPAETSVGPLSIPRPLHAQRRPVGSCEMVAITQRGSALHRAVGDLRPMGSLREQRVAELRAVLGGFGGLGALLPLLERAQIRSLSILKQLSVEELRMKLNEVVGGSLLSVAYLDRLQVLGLCKA